MGLIDIVPRGTHPLSHSQFMKQQMCKRFGTFQYMGSTKGSERIDIDVRIVNNKEKQVIALEMSCACMGEQPRKEDF